MTQTDQLGPMRPWVEAQIAAGVYADEAEAIQTALSALARREAKDAEMRAYVQQGLDDVAAGRVHQYATPEEATDAIMNR